MGLMKILLLLGVIALLFRTFVRQVDHGKGMMLLFPELGFTPLGEKLPESFPVAQTTMAQAIGFGLVASGWRGRREVLLFDSVMKGAHTGIATTVVAARGGEECFPAAKTAKGMMMESAEGWTMVYRPKTLMAAEEVKAIVLGIPA